MQAVEARPISQLSGPKAFLTGFARVAAAPVAILVVALAQFAFARLIVALPLSALRRQIGGSLSAHRLSGPADLAVLLDALADSARVLQGWASTAVPIVLPVGALLLILLEASVLERLRQRRRMTLEQLFAAAGRRGLAFVRATLYAVLFFAAGSVLIDRALFLARKWLRLEDEPSEILRYRLDLASLIAYVALVLLTKTFLDTLKARLLLEESPPFHVERWRRLRAIWTERGTNVTRIAARSLGYVLRHPFRSGSITLLNVAPFLLVLGLLVPVLDTHSGALIPALSLLQGILLTYFRFSFLAGQLSLQESVLDAARVPAPAPAIPVTVVPEPLRAAAPLPAVGSLTPAAVPTPDVMEPAPAILAPEAAAVAAASEAPLAEAALIKTEETLPEAPAPPVPEAAVAVTPSVDLGFLESLPERLPETVESRARKEAEIPPIAPSDASALSASAVSVPVEEKQPEAAEAAIAAGAKPSIDLDFLDSLPERLPSTAEVPVRKDVELSAIPPVTPEPLEVSVDAARLAQELFGAPEVKETVEPEKVVLSEVAPAPAPPVEPVAFMMEEEMDSGRFEVEAPSAPTPPPEAPAAAPLAPRARETAPTARDSMPGPPALATSTRIGVSPGSAPTPSVSDKTIEVERPKAPAEAATRSVEDLLGDVMHEIGGKTVAEVRQEAAERAVPRPPLSPASEAPPAVPPAPPTPPAPPVPPPVPSKAAPAAEPKLTVKDIFGDILEELGGQLPESARDKDKERDKR